MTEREFQKQLRNYRKTQIMSVELAVELLTDCGLECMYEDETREALEMAIEALSVEPCEDCISRQAVLDMRETIEYKDMWHMAQEEEVVSVSNINALPSVTPKQKMGRWVKISPVDIYECSECGQNVMTGDIDAYRYCHGCGAKMAESEVNNG